MTNKKRRIAGAGRNADTRGRALPSRITMAILDRKPPFTWPTLRPVVKTA